MSKLLSENVRNFNFKVGDVLKFKTKNGINKLTVNNVFGDEVTLNDNKNNYRFMKNTALNDDTFDFFRLSKNGTPVPSKPVTLDSIDVVRDGENVATINSTDINYKKDLNDKNTSKKTNKQKPKQDYSEKDDNNTVIGDVSAGDIITFNTIDDGKVSFKVDSSDGNEVIMDLVDVESDRYKDLTDYEEFILKKNSALTDFKGVSGNVKLEGLKTVGEDRINKEVVIDGVRTDEPFTIKKGKSDSENEVDDEYFDGVGKVDFNKAMKDPVFVKNLYRKNSLFKRLMGKYGSGLLTSKKGIEVLNKTFNKNLNSSGFLKKGNKIKFKVLNGGDRNYYFEDKNFLVGTAKAKNVIKFKPPETRSTVLEFILLEKKSADEYIVDIIFKNVVGGNETKTKGKIKITDYNY